jgi:hypothetical protein
MPERAINTRSATGCLLVLLPAALLMSALFVAWPFILGGTLLIAGGNIWQSYEWAKTTRSIDPVFQQLIVQNRGEISPIDLSIRANISGKVSQKYLAIRADEFGTGSRQHPDRGQVYYFVSVSTLGDIFDDSELEIPAIMPAATPVIAFDPAPAQPELIPVIAIKPEPIANRSVVDPSSLPLRSDQVSSDQARLLADLSSVLEPPVEIVEVAADATPESTRSTSLSAPESLVFAAKASPLSNLRQLFDDEETAPTAVAELEAIESQFAAVTTPAAPATDRPLTIIIQSELAKRLDVHPSTIYKRRGEPDFTDWTRNRDPDGFAWGYAEISKEYYQIDT